MATHPADQVVDACAAKLRARTTLGAKVFAHRSLSLSEPDQELPAVCVHGGDDSPMSDTGALNVSIVDSELDVHLEIYATGATDEEVKTELGRLRRECQAALLADVQQGTSFIVNTRYGGAARPVTNSEGTSIVHMLEVLFRLHYRMTTAGDPA